MKEVEHTAEERAGKEHSVTGIVSIDHFVCSVFSLSETISVEVDVGDK